MNAAQWFELGKQVMEKFEELNEAQLAQVAGGAIAVGGIIPVWGVIGPD